MRYEGPRGAARLVVQIGRGRSAAPFRAETIDPILAALPAGLDYTFGYGYRSTTWWRPPFEDGRREPFGFVNVGMFARLSGGVRPGEVFACTDGVAVVRRDASSGRLVVAADEPLAGENAAAAIVDAGLPSVRLVGIADDMPFVTPADYGIEELLLLLQQGG